MCIRGGWVMMVVGHCAGLCLCCGFACSSCLAAEVQSLWVSSRRLMALCSFACDL